MNASSASYNEARSGFLPRLDVSVPTMRLPLLITGITGVAGMNALHWFQARYPGQVVGIRPTQTWQVTGPGMVAMDTEDMEGLSRLFEEYGFQAVLNTTGNCALKSCELDPAMARRTNASSADTISRLARKFGARLVHLSSDLVFSGLLDRPYRETDTTDPVTMYGKTMYEGEQAVAANDPQAAILRISLPMGPSYNHHAGAIDWIQSRFRNQRPATLYIDEVRCPTYVDDLSRVCALVLQSDAAGIYHAGSPRGITLFQIAQVINRVGDYDPTLLKGIPRREAGPMPPRAGDCRMDSGKLRSLLGGEEFQPWPLGDDIVPRDDHWHRERPAGEGNGPQRLRDRLYRYPVHPTDQNV